MKHNRHSHFSKVVFCVFFALRTTVIYTSRFVGAVQPTVVELSEQ